MTIQPPTLFKWRHFQGEIIVLCTRWYLRYGLSYRDLEEMMAERGLKVDHSTIARWVLAYAPELERRVKPLLKPTNDSWKVDETYIKVKGEWLYQYRAVVGRPSSSSSAPNGTRRQLKPSSRKRWGRRTPSRRA